ncbi:MAG: PilW family protein [Gammaproteobacteria bacterium]
MSLIELLVAMTLGLLIIAGIGQIYLAAKRSYDIQTSIAQIQEVGRFVTEVLTQDIRRAGYWGLFTLNTAGLDTVLTGQVFPTGDQSPDGTCPSGNDYWGRMITRKVFGLNDTATGYACLGSNYKLGDIITLRYANPLPVTSYDPNALYIHTAPLEASLVFGDPASCPPASGCALIDYVDNDMNYPGYGYYDYAVVAHAYYLTDSTTATQCGDVAAPALPALARETLSSGASSPGFPVKTELVTGVEQLQFQYGVDTDADGSVNQYVIASPTVNWDQVRAVRFWVLVRSDCPEGGYTDTSTYRMANVTYTPNDNFRRALYTATVALRS